MNELEKEVKRLKERVKLLEQIKELEEMIAKYREQPSINPIVTIPYPCPYYPRPGTNGPWWEYTTCGSSTVDRPGGPSITYS